MSDARHDRVEVEGMIHVGRGLDLVQSVKHRPQSDSFFEVGRPQGMPQIDYTPHLAHPGELVVEELEYSLSATDRDIYIVDDGLCASYGIFGAPGSGKTNLLKHLLYQALALHRDDPNLKYGALILDPKAALIEDVRTIVELAGRQDDLTILNTDELIARKEALNVIDTALDPYELGKQLVLAAQSAGVSTSDPYWLLAWANLFGAACYLLSLGNDVVTLRTLLDEVLDEVPIGETMTVDDSPNAAKRERRIVRTARLLRGRLQDFTPEQQEDAKSAINQIDKFFQQENDNVATIENIIVDAYSPFQRSRYACYSGKESRELSNRRQNFYDQIIDDGKIVMVSLSPAEPRLAKTLCTLVKCLFQRSVLSRHERVQTSNLLAEQGKVLPPRALRNFTRPVLIACDEYSQVASEVPGQPMGDGDFFSQSRQNGCMGLLATQSVNVLQASSLKDAWRSVFSNCGGKIFMRLVDNETAEEATKLAGESDWYVSSQGTSRSKDGLGSSTQTELRERKSLPTSVLTQVFQKGDAVVLGSLDGSGNSFTRFLHVPKCDKTSEATREGAHA